MDISYDSPFKQQMSDTGDILTNLENWEGPAALFLTYKFGRSISTKPTVTPATRRALAEEFYSKAGGNVKHTNGIVFTKKVFTKAITHTKDLYQWTINGELGDYFTNSPSAKKLGLPTMPNGTPAYWDDVAQAYKPRPLVKVKLQKGTSTKGLNSTAATVESWDPPGGTNIGGSQQIYAPDIKNMNPTIIKQ